MNGFSEGPFFVGSLFSTGLSILYKGSFLYSSGCLNQGTY